MEITNEQKVAYLVSMLGDQDLDQYETWIIWCGSNRSARLPTYVEFKSIYREIDESRFKNPTLYRSEEWIKEWRETKNDQHR